MLLEIYINHFNKFKHNKKKGRKLYPKNKSKSLSLKTYKYERWFSEGEVEDEDKVSVDIPQMPTLESNEEIK